jgi:hypothetical protein
MDKVDNMLGKLLKGEMSVKETERINRKQKRRFVRRVRK